MSIRLQYRIVATSALALILGCEEPFTPKGEFHEDPVVYSILSNLSDTHYARLYRAYDPPGFDPFGHATDNFVTGALVRISDGTTQWVFRDTLIARADSSRYTSPLGAYVFSPLPIVRGRQYTLFVQTPGGTPLTATATVPAIGYIEIFRNQGAVIGQIVSDPNIGIRATVPASTKGYLVRFHVTFDALENAVWVPHLIEIPYFIHSPGLPDESYLYYGVTRSIEETSAYSTVVTHTVDFHIDSYNLVKYRLYGRYGSGAVRFKKAIFTLTQVDQGLYNYYNISRGFRDPNSIRVDEPDYTNINGGVGVFGAFAVDSVVVNFPTTP